MEIFDILVEEYSEKNWRNYSSCFVDVDTRIDGVPQDIVNAVITILGETAGCKWLSTPLRKLNGKTAIELAQTDEGRKALKSYIMRLPN